MENSGVTSRPYRWGKFQGWAMFVGGVVVWVPTLLGPRHGIIHWLITLLASGVMIFMGLGLIQRQRIGLILLYANLPVFILGFFVLNPPPLETALIVLWYFIPAVVYYPRRFKEFSSSSVAPSESAPPIQTPKPPVLLPDLGKHLAARGTPQNTMLIYLTWEMDTLQIVGPGRYCTTRVQRLKDNLYCATFDFDADILMELMRAAPLDTINLVTAELDQDEVSARTITLPTAISVGIGAVLGNLQQGLHDLFIPLIIVEVITGKTERNRAGAL